MKLATFVAMCNVNTY